MVKKLSNTLPSHMNAMAWHGEHTPLPLTLERVPVPKPKKAEVLIKVGYVGVNRAELFQSNKHYPLPTAIPRIPGLEYSGTIVKLGADVKGFKIGQRVCGIVMEGAYAEYVISPSSLLLPVPDKLPLKEAACLPEAMLTTWVSVVEQARLKKGETVLMHAGGSGIGVIAIQMLRAMGAKVIVTAGNDLKCMKCKKLGAYAAINYKTHDFEEEVLKLTGGKGVDVVFDMVGGEYTQKHLNLLKLYGRLTLISFLAGAKTSLNLAPILLKKLSIHGSLLRNRPTSEKGLFVKRLQRSIWPMVRSGKIKPVIDSVYALEDAKKALHKMEESLNFGKILLQVAPD